MTRILKGENPFHRDCSSPGSMSRKRTACVERRKGREAFSGQPPESPAPDYKSSPQWSPEGLKTLPTPQMASSQHAVPLSPHRMPSSPLLCLGINCQQLLASDLATLPSGDEPTLLTASLHPPSASVRSTQDPQPHLVAVSPPLMAAERFRVPDFPACTSGGQEKCNQFQA